MAPKSLLFQIKIYIIVLSLFKCLPIHANPECLDFYSPKAITQSKPRSGPLKSFLYRILGKSEDPAVGQFLSDLNLVWKGDLKETRESIAPLFKRYQGKLTSEQFTEVAVRIAKKTASSCDFCALIGFKALVNATVDYMLNPEQISRIRSALKFSIEKTDWNPFTGHDIQANVLLNYTPIGKHQAIATSGVNTTYESARALNISSREKLYQSLSASLDGRYEGFTIKRWGQKGLPYLELLNKLQKDFTGLVDGDLRSLIVDTGLVLRMPDAVIFLKEKLAEIAAKNDGTKVTPWELRENFSHILGKRKMYRALALTEATYNDVIKKGLESTFVRTLRSKEIDLNVNKRIGGDNPFTTSVPLLVEARLSGPALDIDPILSISSSPEVAIGATIPYYDRLKLYSNEPIKIYLFELEIPELDLYRRSSNQDDILNFEDKATINFVLEDTGTKKKKTFSRNDPGFEVFMDLKIDVREIISAKEIDLKTFQNRAYWTRNGSIPRGQYGNKIYIYEDKR